MIRAAMRYKYKFMTEAQALLHGDLHSGSIMVTDTDTKVIDPEFGFMGPMAFDIGNYIGNLLLAYFSRHGWDANEQRRADYQEWLLQQIVQTRVRFHPGVPPALGQQNTGRRVVDRNVSTEQGRS